MSVLHNRFLEIAKDISPRLHEAIEQCGPARLSRRAKDACLATTLCRAVAGQQLSTSASATIWNRVLEKMGQQELVEFMSEVDVEALRRCGLSQAKAKTCKEVATATQAGQLDVDYLGKLQHETRSEQITQIWGVGQWTADMIGIFFFGDRDVWPAGDVTVCKTLQTLIGKRRSIERSAAKFAPQRSYLALYMYRIADARPS